MHIIAQLNNFAIPFTEKNVKFLCTASIESSVLQIKLSNWIIALKIHEQVAFNHSVIQLTFVVCCFSEAALKLGVGGEQIELPVFRV